MYKEYRLTRILTEGLHLPVRKRIKRYYFLTRKGSFRYETAGNAFSWNFLQLGRSSLERTTLAQPGRNRYCPTRGLLIVKCTSIIGLVSKLSLDLNLGIQLITLSKTWIPTAFPFQSTSWRVQKTMDMILTVSMDFHLVLSSVLWSFQSSSKDSQIANNKALIRVCNRNLNSNGLNITGKSGGGPDALKINWNSTFRMNIRSMSLTSSNKQDILSTQYTQRFSIGVHTALPVSSSPSTLEPTTGLPRAWRKYMKRKLGSCRPNQLQEVSLIGHDTRITIVYVVYRITVSKAGSSTLNSLIPAFLWGEYVLSMHKVQITWMISFNNIWTVCRTAQD